MYGWIVPLKTKTGQEVAQAFRKLLLAAGHPSRLWTDKGTEFCKDPAERATLVKEYVTAMKTVKQRNMANRELKLAIGDELQTLFHPIAEAAEETRKELEPMKKTLTDIDGALNRSAPQPGKNVDTTFDIYMRGDGELVMGNKVVQVGENEKTLTVDDTVYDLTSGLYSAEPSTN